MTMTAATKEPTTRLSRLGEAALTYAQRLGWPVFPVHWITKADTCSCSGRPDCTPGKHPLTGQGFKEATRDEAQIRAWWARWPAANIGIPTGQASGFDVLDVDPRHGGEESLAELEAKYGKLPDTVEQLTGGGGQHFLFKHREGVSNKTGLLPGLDARGEGGYVIVPPSKGMQQLYAWELSSRPSKVPIAEWPTWALELVRKPARVERDTPTLPPVEGPTTAYGRAALVDEAERVQHASPGTQESTLNSASFNLGTLIGAGMVENQEALSVLVDAAMQMDRAGTHPVTVAEVSKIIIDGLADGRQHPRAVPAATAVNEGSVSAPGKEWPDPPDKAAYHGLAGDIVQAIEPHTEADPVAILLQILVGVGSIVGADAYYEVEGACHPARDFVVLVGATSKARKGTSWRQVIRPLRTVDPEWADHRVLSGLSSGEGLIWAVRDSITRQEPIREGNKRAGRITGYETVVVDEGIADKRLLINEGEFAGVLRVLGRDGNTLSAVLRQGWDDGALRTLTKNSPAVATGAHISMIGHITREELLRYLTSTEQGNGFANRLLWAAVRRSKTLPEGGTIESVDFAPLLRKLGKATEHGHALGRLKFDSSARAMWHAVYPDLSAGKPGLLGAVTARGEAHVVRLALTYALLDCAGEIRADHLEAALAVWEYCERSAAWIFGDATGDPVADRIMDAVRQAPDGLSRTEIRDLFGRHQSTERTSHALALLVGADRVTREQVDTGGRPVERYRSATKAT